MKFKKLFSLSTLLAVAVSPSFAQCVVGGTNFDVPTSLFDPAMENDNNPINGWLNENARDILDDMCGGTCSYYELPSKANQIGLKTNTIVSDGGLPPENYDPTSVTAPVVGAVVANPKLIHPYFKDMPGSNMFVNIGSAHSVPVLSYTVSGLEPGSRVSFSADAYSLFDVDVLKYLYSEGVSVLNLEYGRYSYNETSNTLIGNGLSVAVGSSLQPNGELKGAMANGKPIPYGKSISLTSTATVDEYGSVTFYIARGSDSKAIPLGIDNIEIKGEIKPNIKTVGTPCPAMESLFTLRSTYPEGTTYSWKEDKTGDRSDKQSFTFSPPDVGDYAVSCEVSLPGCSPVVSDKYEFAVGNCCSDGNGTPMSMSYLLYEDFGDFTSATTYEYTDEKMVTHTINIPASQIMYTEDKGNLPFIVDYPGSDAVQIPPCRPNSGIWDGAYAISNLNPYSKGVQHDNSGTNTGGMMVIDLTGSSCLDVLYERTISGLCPGKDFHFSTDFAAINKNVSGGLVGTLAIQLVDASNNTELYRVTKDLTGDEPWQVAEYTFDSKIMTVPESVILRVLNLSTTCTGPGIACFAIDNIIVSACTPPDINISSNLSSSELLDLCTGMPLVLEAENSMAAKNYYEEISYLFQYTYSDPSTTDTEKITWHNLGDVQKNNTFEIAEPASHIAFAPLAGTNDRIYFRVLMGNESDLNTPSLWEPYDAFSPCRIISYSAFPVVAGLNCAECKAPTERLESVSFCEGSLASEPSKTIKGFMIDWFADPDLTMAIAEPEIKDLKESETFYYVLTDMATGCAGEVTEYEVTVAKAESNPVDNSKMIVYRKSDAKAGPLKTLAQQNLSVFATALSNKEYTLMIGLVDNYTLSEEPDLRTASLAEASDVMPAPTVEDIASVEDEYRWYYTYMESPEGCVSDTVLVGVVIKGAPSPITINASYCVNSDNVQTFDKYADVSREDPLGTLKFYKSDGTEIADPSTEKPDVTTAGEHIYYVSQVSSYDGGESEKKHIVIKVYDVAPAVLSQPSAKYCYNSWSEVIDGVFSTAATSNYVVGSDDANASWEFFKNEPALKQPMPGASTMRPSTSEAGETSYYGRVKYKLSAAEVCYGAHVEYPVEVVKVPDPVVNSAITYQKSDGVNGFKKPSDQDPTAFIFDKGCTVIWYDENKSMISESDATPIYNKDLTDNDEKIYYVSQVNMNGCESDLVEVKIIVSMNQTSLSNVTANTVTITPNPASTKINVVADGVIEKVEILNTVGKVVKVSDSKEINIADMHNGVYFVRATIDGETSVHRLVVNK